MSLPMDLIFIELIKDSILSVKTEDWDEAREEIINNFKNKKINFIPCKSKLLYLSKENIKKYIEEYLYSLDKFFTKLSNNKIIPRRDIDNEEIKVIINLGTEIIVHKQQNKRFFTSFTRCPCPTIPIKKKEIDKLEKFIKIKKYRNNDCSYGNNDCFRGLSDVEYYSGFETYKSMINDSDNCIYETIGGNGFCHLYSLYKSNNGSIYLLDIQSFNYVISYTRLI